MQVQDFQVSQVVTNPLKHLISHNLIDREREREKSSKICQQIPKDDSSTFILSKTKKNIYVSSRRLNGLVVRYNITAFCVCVCECVRWMEIYTLGHKSPTRPPIFWSYPVVPGTARSLQRLWSPLAESRSKSLLYSHTGQGTCKVSLWSTFAAPPPPLKTVLPSFFISFFLL